jgi:iron complex outermembrane recepter protein
MKVKNYTLAFLILTFLLSGNLLFGQTTIKGKVVGENSEPLIAASIYLLESGDGAYTDNDGKFELKTKQAFPFTIRVSYTGYENQEIKLTTASEKLVIKLVEDTNILDSLNIIVIDKQRPDILDKSPQRKVYIGEKAITQNSGNDISDLMGKQPGFDVQTGSIAFKIVNTRGFNSNSPVRMLSIIDGVDNQSPGLNFSLGTFLGSSELDISNIILISGASSSFYGPNAFNGVISMETKNPFYSKGLSANVKVGERNLREVAIRYANSFKNKDSLEVAAFKLNLFYLKADDWVADNYEPITGAKSDKNNPGRYDAVNIYGDEYSAGNIGVRNLQPGLETYYRIGYKEIDLVDYNTQNIKANLSLHFRTKPSLKDDSPEFIISSSFGSGTTVYQGDNRFSLRGINFFQNRLEYRKKGKWFIRAYATNEDAGQSYDPYFTALLLQENAKSDDKWSKEYRAYWQTNIAPLVRAADYPEPYFDPQCTCWIFDPEAEEAWLLEHQDALTAWHTETANAVNKEGSVSTQDFFEPGTDRFNEEFDRITSTKSNNKQEGTLFYDKSALYHLHGEYIFETTEIDHITIGGNGRLYKPNSDGTIFYDTAGTSITNWEAGAYVGLHKTFYDGKLNASATLRVDKNQNFKLLATPAASLVWEVKPKNFLRLSFSSAIRNPTLSDQYLNLDVGRATLAGNLHGVDSLITVPSFQCYLPFLQKEKLEYFSIDPIQPEKVKSIEIGYRANILKRDSIERLAIDASYYYSIYNDFIGYRIGIDTEFDDFSFPVRETFNVYRYAANSSNQVSTQGFTIGLDYNFWKRLYFNGNYSWNKLITKIDDPIIPAYNTPEHKFNLGISGSNLDIKLGKKTLKGFGFNVNYKWIEGFIFEGSPQFTGYVPTYDLLDAQINVHVKRIHTTFKIGASNILNNKQFQTYGGPRIGRLAYISILYEFRKT